MRNRAEDKGKGVGGGEGEVDFAWWAHVFQTVGCEYNLAFLWCYASTILYNSPKLIDV